MSSVFGDGSLSPKAGTCDDGHLVLQRGKIIIFDRELGHASNPSSFRVAFKGTDIDGCRGKRKVRTQTYLYAPDGLSSGKFYIAYLGPEQLPT